VGAPRIIVGSDAQALPSVAGGGAVASKEAAAVGRCQSQLPLHAGHNELTAQPGALDDVQTPERFRHGGDEMWIRIRGDIEEPTVAEAEVAEQELDESLVIGGKIDMADIVREQILLAIPEQLLCSEDCRGLCPKCGENRNLIDCNCADDDIDPRWAALKNLN